MNMCCAAEDLRKVDLVLPPPARLDAGAAEGALPLATRKALGQLFAACGLSADFVGELGPAHDPFRDEHSQRC